jgi:hypothetical protein
MNNNGQQSNTTAGIALTPKNHIHPPVEKQAKTQN